MISVCIPTYNGEKYIHAQLESILNQLSSEDEVIISDDSSTDNTIQIIKSFNDSRIKLLENNTFHSPIYNLENALKNANGDYIFLSDQDDIWKSDKVAIVMSYLHKSIMVIHDADIIDGNGNLLYSSFYTQNKTRKSRIYNFIKNGYLGCCIAFNRILLEKALPFPKSLPMHDIWLGNVAAFKYKKVQFIPQKLISYRRHKGNISIASEKSYRHIKQRLSDRFIIFKNLLIRH